MTLHPASLTRFDVTHLQSSLGQRPLITVAWGIAPGFVTIGRVLADGQIHRYRRSSEYGL